MTVENTEHINRASLINQLAFASTYDIGVIGGGATGLGVALPAFNRWVNSWRRAWRGGALPHVIWGKRQIAHVVLDSEHSLSNRMFPALHQFSGSLRFKGWQKAPLSSPHG